jgi:ribulose-5-phosphate 4-epimerase/fuculose-1-phosphate aldolase
VVAEEVAAGARLAARAGLFEGLGHISVRAGGGSFVMTTTGPLGATTADHVLLVSELPSREDHPPALPLETAVHAAIYAARPDVWAIVRAHSPSAVVAGLDATVPPVTHGLGGIAGEVVFHADPQLVTDRVRGDAVARSLGGADCVILARNGTVAVADSLPVALVRAWFLEERCRVWLAAGRPAGMPPDELAARRESYPAEVARVWRWLQWRFGDHGRR